MKIRHKAMGVAAAVMLLTVGSAGVGLAASNQSVASPAREKAAAASSFNTNLIITVTNLPSGKLLLLNYGDSVIQSLGGTAQATQGAISTVDLVQGSMLLFGSGTTPLSAAINVEVTVDESTVSGTATVPAGATVTVGNGNGTTVPVTNGAFTLPVNEGVGKPSPKNVIFSPSGAKDLAITAPAIAGKPVHLRPNTGAASQVWTITSPGNPSYPGTAIFNKQTGLCLDATSQQAKTQVTAAKCDGSAAQQWVESKQANGTWQLNAFNYTSPVLQAAATIGSSNVRLVSPSSKDVLRSWIERSPA
jgi:Ricin-type beta-trefoil lectin domain-like